MAVRTFSATIDNTWHTAGNWDTAPGAGDTCVIAANCTASTDLSGTVYAALTVNNGITLTVANGRNWCSPARPRRSRARWWCRQAGL